MRAGTVRGSVPWPATLKVVRDAIQIGFKSLMGLPVTMLPPSDAVLRICTSAMPYDADGTSRQGPSTHIWTCAVWQTDAAATEANHRPLVPAVSQR